MPTVPGDREKSAKKLGLASKLGEIDSIPVPASQASHTAVNVAAVPPPAPPEEPARAPGSNEYFELAKSDPDFGDEYAQLEARQGAVAKDNLKASVYIGTGKDPDRAAKVLSLSKKLGLPPDTVERNFDQFSRDEKIASNDYDALVQKNPGLAAWLQNPDNASVAHDDLKELSAVEKTIQDHGTAWKALAAFNQGAARLAGGAARLPNLIGQTAYLPYNLMQRRRGEQEVQYPSSNPVADWIDKQAESYGSITPELSDSIVGKIGEGDYSGAGAAAGYQVMAQLPQLAVIFASGGAGALGRLGALGGLGAVAAADKAKELEEKGIEPSRATPVALASGAVEIGTESLGTFRFIKVWGEAIVKEAGKEGAREIFKSMGKVMMAGALTEGVEESAAEFSNSFLDYVTDIDPDAMKNLPENIANAGIVGFLTGGVATGPGTLAQAQNRIAKEKQSNLARDFYLSLGSSLEAVKLRKRLPEAQRQYVESLVKDGPVENVYISPEAVEKYFQSQEEIPAAAMKKLGVLEAFEEAKETGGQVKIPLAVWTQNYLETDTFKALANDIKFDPGELSINELKADQEQAKQEIEAVDKEAKPLTEDEKLSESGKAVRDDVAAQLKAINEDPSQAVLFRGFEVLGRRAGRDPLDLYNRYKLSITKGEPVQDPMAAQSPDIFDDVISSYQKEAPQDASPEEQQMFQEERARTKKDLLELARNALNAIPDAPRDSVADALGLPRNEVRLLKNVSKRSGKKATGSYSKEEILTAAKVVYNQTYNQDGSSALTPLGFFSQVEQEVSKMDFKQVPGKDLANRIRNIQGIKKEELESLGLLDWLNAAEGKVSKEEVVAFIKNNGLEVSQIVLGQDSNLDEDSDGQITVADLSWSEQERDHSNDSENINNEYDYYRNDDTDGIEEATKEIRERIVEEYTTDGEVDEAALEKAIESELDDIMYKRAQDYVESDEYVSASFTVTEEKTGWELSGSDEYGWYNSETEENFETSLQEAQIQLARLMIEKGEIQGDATELSKEEDLEWRNPKGVTPSHSTIKKKAKALFEKDKERFKKKELEEFPGMYEELSGKELDAKLEEEAFSQAINEVEESYNNADSPRNKIAIRIKHPVIEGKIEGNNKKGYTLGISERESVKLAAKEIEAAKTEAIEKMREMGLFGAPKKASDDPDFDINAVSGKAKFRGYKVPGGENYRELLITLPKIGPEKFVYDNHFSQKNVVAHVRLTDRLNSEGKKTLFVEELQSDWHQQGRERGYQPKEFADTEKAVALATEEMDAARDAMQKSTEALNEHLANSYPEKAMDDTSTVLWRQVRDAPAPERQSAIDLVGQETYDRLIADEVANSLLKEARAASDAFAAAQNKTQDLKEKFSDMGDMVPDAPFKNTDAWAGLALKRIIRMAVGQGYEAVAWTPAEVHVNRWGTDSVSWAKKDAGGFEIVDKDGKSLEGGFKTKEEAQAALNKRAERFKEFADLELKEKDVIEKYKGEAGYDYAAKRLAIMAGEWSDVNEARLRQLDEEFSGKEDGATVSEVGPHWLVGSVEQVGGNADGTDIEEMARERGKLLERKGERVTSKEDLRAVISDTLNRERNDRSLESLTDSVWKQMQEKDSGVKAPRKEGMEFFYDNMIPRKVLPPILKKLDSDVKIGVTEISLDSIDLDNNERKMKVLSFPISEKIKEKAMSGFSLFQPGDQGPRGQISFGANRQFNIALLQNANKSTFIHETGHFYVEVMRDIVADIETLAERTESQELLIEDYNTLLDWAGAKPGEPISVESHEMIARGFEAYLMEGKAPTSALRRAFARFRIWLVNVYRTIGNLNVNLTPEVRGVMDRMLATEEEIDAAIQEQNQQPLFSDPKFQGMSIEKTKAYLRATEEAREHAASEVNRKLIAHHEKVRSEEYGREKEALIPEIEAEVSSRPVYQAIEKFRNEKLPNGDPLKLSFESVQEFGKEVVKQMPRGVVAKKKGGLGIPVDMAADILGFDSATDLITQLSNAEEKSALVNRLADEQMDERYPDLLETGLNEEVIQVVHNQSRAKMLRMELEHLASNNMPVLKEAIRRVARRVPTEKAVRAQAIAIIGQKQVKEIRPFVYQRAEAKAAKEAGVLLAKGDINGAFEAKRKELLNHELYLAATQAVEDMEKSLDKFKRIYKADEKVAKSRDMDLVNTARAILSQFGIGKPDKTPESYVKQIKEYDPTTYETVIALIESATERAGPLDQVSFDDFTAMRDSVYALWDMAKTTKEIDIEGKKMSLDEARAMVEAEIESLTTGKERSGYTESASKWEKTKIALLGARASLIRVEHWAKAVGPSTVKVIFNPISDASTQYRLKKTVVMKQYLETLRAWAKSQDQTKIVSDELQHTFKNKVELMMAILHSGNESNLSKLLRGRAWGEVDENGVLDRSRWDQFTARLRRDGVLTKADYEFAQNIWDLMESLKPQAQKAHKEMHGHYFSEITAGEIVTEFGTFKGGYIPAKVDTHMSEDAKVRRDREEFEQSNTTFQFPTTGRGFTKSRVDNYVAPLSLDMSLLGSHIDGVLRFSYIEPTVKQVARIVNNKEFRSKLKELDPTIGSETLIPWLQRAATQKVVTPSQDGLGRVIDSAAAYLRQTAALQFMFLNVKNTLEQVTGFAVAASIVKPKYLRNAMATYITGPKRNVEMVLEKSDFIKTIYDTSIYQSYEAINQIIVNPSTFQSVRAFSNRHTYFTQAAMQNIVNTITWTAAYEQGIEKGFTEAEAVRDADSVIRRTQGSNLPEDISRFESGSATKRMFTQFAGYFNMIYNLNQSEIQNISRSVGLKKGAGKLFYLYLTAFMLPSVGAMMVGEVMRNSLFDDEDDDGYLDDMLAKFAGSQFGTATAMIPFAGQAINAGVNRFNKNFYDDRISLSPAVSVLETSVGAPKVVYDAITGDMKNKKKSTKDVLMFVGLATGTPTGAVARPVGYLMDVSDRKAKPTGPVDFTRGLVSGSPGAKK